uniref:Uncharacterized protein n=1 Tax=Pithovirus LCDPAC01 TaxID=2506600 RepID=A0A481YP30_9VIRU|nr:MAG: hypothetical protein LCDPAC01_00430 [Pithovirus LCDPAC01]
MVHSKMEYKEIPDIKNKTNASIRDEFNAKIIPPIEYNTKIKSADLPIELMPLHSIDEKQKTAKDIRISINVELDSVWQNLTSIADQTSAKRPSSNFEVEGGSARKLHVGINKVLAEIRKSFGLTLIKHGIRTVEFNDEDFNIVAPFTLEHNEAWLAKTIGEPEESSNYDRIILRLDELTSTVKELIQIVRLLVDEKKQESPKGSNDRLQIISLYLEGNIDITKEIVSRDDVKNSLNEKGIPSMGIQASILNREISSYASRSGATVPKNSVRKTLGKLGFKYIRTCGFNIYHTFNFKNREIQAFAPPKKHSSTIK